MKFYQCAHCGNIVAYMENHGVPVMCCGQKMQEIVPGSVDASVEKHVPVAAVEGDKVTVTVGAAAHPMIEAHHIAWIVLETAQGFQKKDLDPTGAPTAVFALAGDKPTAVYAYCNLHGLWMAEI